MDIGFNIRAIRKRKNITIAQICEETGLSQGFMSQVETNKTSPSISTLEGIASALNVPLAFLLLKKDERMKVIRKDERKQTTSGSDHLKVEHLGSTKSMRMVIVELPPGTSTGKEQHTHEGEEVHVVLKGHLYVEQGEDFAELTEGDTFSWNACVPHIVKNIGDEIATVVISIYREAEYDEEYI
ncbi:MAG: cupin domain-containing protein [Gorillibacterium sp.]|nr:cupin domain-containing protein [Gorillibacterium sp.]